MTLYISPFRRLVGLREAMDRMLDESMNQVPSGDREMLLPVDVLAEDEAFTVTALVPGLEADDLDIEILNNTVTIRGEFRETEANEDVKYLTCELPQGRFVRVISLPVALDPSKAEANMKNGVLSLRIPKAESHRPKAIKVNVE